MGSGERTRLRGREMMPDMSFRMMEIMMRFFDLFGSPDTRLDEFGIQDGFVVVDYGCGPARYVRKASAMVGPGGKVIAADVHPLALAAVERVIRKHGLVNVTPVLIQGYDSGLESDAANVVYALDMFHAIADPGALLTELNRITRPDGVLFLEDGHQPRSETLRKLEASEKWRILEAKTGHLKCQPVKG